VETELLVEALSSDLVSLVEIDNLPSLLDIVFASTSSIHNKCLTFFILTVFNFKDLAVCWIDEVFTIKFEDLEPSGVGGPDLHICCSSSALDIP
jgi:hypothetical protein